MYFKAWKSPDCADRFNAEIGSKGSIPGAEEPWEVIADLGFALTLGLPIFPALMKISMIRSSVSVGSFFRICEAWARKEFDGHFAFTATFAPIALKKPLILLGFCAYKYIFIET
jgi:hypothetical protein